jgi:hypothetical protein
MQLPKDFREFIELMTSNGVRFVMIGGYAFNLYSNPRATGDIDFFISIDIENQQKLRKTGRRERGAWSVEQGAESWAIQKDFAFKSY